VPEVNVLRGPFEWRALVEGENVSIEVWSDEEGLLMRYMATPQAATSISVMIAKAAKVAAGA
jgi:hypothetical protein